jgi:para-aminobenzoate synthetase / 4-amino-4-deoxychorismate lyase
VSDWSPRAFVRFDDSRPGGSAITWSDPKITLVAREVDEVVGVLAAADAATRTGSWACGYIAYEAAAAFDPALSSGRHRRPTNTPLAWFGVFDEPGPVEPVSRSSPEHPGYTIGPWCPDVDAESYRQKVERVRTYIAEGHTYQTNLTARLRASFAGDPFALYRDLANAQSSPYCAYLDTGRFVVASASPELFFEWTDQRVVTRPMKGTGRRGRWAEEDEEAARRLRASDKDRAENVMIVDLVRNDLGRIAEWGSVRVDELFALERYQTLWQMTSTISARPRPSTNIAELFCALFPSGSVTGAPKRRTMELIAEIEDSPRGVYCGAIGWLAPAGSPIRARFSVAIRTAVVDRERSSVLYGAGGGITWDSDPAAELDELRAKTAILSGPVEECSLIETMGFWPDIGVRNLSDHLRRLSASADYLGFSYDERAVRDALTAATEGVEPRRLRLLLNREGTASVERSPLPAPTSAPVRLAVDLEAVDESSVWLFHKTTHRQVYEARAARHPDADDVVLVNRRGEVTETTIANLAVFCGGCWCTPPLDSGCLPGIARAQLLASGHLIERPLSIGELRGAEAVAVVSSLRGWRPAQLIEQGAAPLAAPLSGTSRG